MVGLHLSPSATTDVNRFVNWPNGDAHLTVHTEAGLVLPGPFDVDPDGKVRGTGAGAVQASSVGGTVASKSTVGTSLVISRGRVSDVATWDRGAYQL